MKRPITLSAAALILACMCSCSKSDKQKDTSPAPVKVVTMCVQPTDVGSSRVYSGTVEESDGTVISFPIGGTLSRLAVEEGQMVQRGQLIGQLDAASLRNAYQIAKSTTAQAQDAYDRMKMLHDSNSLPDMQWVQVQNALDQAKSAEEIARRAISDATLTAPVSGYILHKFARQGMTVAPAEPIVKIVTLNPVKVTFSVPENEIALISKGQSADITVEAIDDGHFSGPITDKGIEANAITRAYDVKITLKNPGNKLMPGMICDVTLQGETPSTGIVLPNQAVLLDADNQNFVWLNSHGTARKANVKVEGMTDSGIIVSGGIAPGDSVIVEGQQKVSEGTPVYQL